MKFYSVLNAATCRVLQNSFKQYWHAVQNERVFEHHSFSTFLSLNCQRKDVSKYEQVDCKKYASLVRSVVSTNVSPQTPETLLGEDSCLYGPVIRSKPASADTESESPQNLAPFLNFERQNTKYEPGPVLKLPLQLKSQGDHSKASLPSVTRILQLTKSLEQAFYLERWKRRMITELGQDGFKEYSKNILNRGKLFHSALEETLLSTKIPKTDDEEIAGYLQSVQGILADIRGIRVLESVVSHQPLQYMGLVDCVAEYRGKLCVIDWKTSEKPKPYFRNTFDNPLQVAAYAGALNHDDNYNFQVERGLIVVAYKDGSPAHAHFMDRELFLACWKKWLLRLEKYKEKIHASL
ncbi:mitochondrial genome maintenance exonuclease 1 [Rhincodon typus]|uniref:mitochondrial genome maintenance exonuclease 1 n=1 Tax=Rhincodon typus TaxID=259920 RepID=UPI0009A2DCDD|nr:mitochondrial genome maintenance exonuclease 1 [Rhincodon typus]XP_048456771.1 mitochondrial genome maintenance exonuclease 1 [Rhincodon typus]XP_048456772.1 mitochondrial genome maintenance exonuclease 1 [Rhincodon typus]XP_048456773.1 mitochondrial genome maintenance exonuclease 1 [Rhincodon typus]XP_048456775.1 mitochondrial genome maintenance exonuclease 1 [Rhincodon typus]